MYEINFKYRCHDCGGEYQIFNCTVHDKEYDLCLQCFDERIEESEDVDNELDESDLRIKSKKEDKLDG